MALIPETGAGVPGADTYATLADLATYCTNFGYTAPPTGVQEAFLRRAAIAMESMRWLGAKTATTDSLAWPRANVLPRGLDLTTLPPPLPLPNNVIPVAIVQGQIQLCLELYALSVTPGFDAGASGRIVSIQQTVSGAVTLNKTYDNTGRSSVPLPHDASDAIFAPLLAGGAFGAALAMRA